MRVFFIHMKKNIYLIAIQKKASPDIQIESETITILLHFIYTFMRHKWKPVIVDMTSSSPHVTFALIS